MPESNPVRLASLAAEPGFARWEPLPASDAGRFALDEFRRLSYPTRV
jgi:hypothetical protein